ncbi:MAG: MarR family transcriptional regulator [Acidimicrobiia bacterium]
MPNLAVVDVERLERSLALLGRRAGPLHAILAERAGVSLDRVACLVLKAVAAGGSIRITDLARELGVEVPTMSRHVANLTQAGYLQKAPDPVDGRVWWVELTGKAKNTIERLEYERRLVLSNVFSNWTRADRDTFVDLLDRFSSDVTHHAEQADV